MVILLLLTVKYQSHFFAIYACDGVSQRGRCVCTASLLCLSYYLAITYTHERAKSASQ